MVFTLSSRWGLASLPCRSQYFSELHQAQKGDEGGSMLLLKPRKETRLLHARFFMVVRGPGPKSTVGKATLVYDQSRRRSGGPPDNSRISTSFKSLRRRLQT